MAACGEEHTLAVTKAGMLWAWDKGAFGILGHNDNNDRLLPTQVEAQHFGHAKIVSTAAGHTHSAAITEHGGLYTWGEGRIVEEEPDNDFDDDEEVQEVELPTGLGHIRWRDKVGAHTRRPSSAAGRASWALPWPAALTRPRLRHGQSFPPGPCCADCAGCC